MKNLDWRTGPIVKPRSQQSLSNAPPSQRRGASKYKSTMESFFFPSSTMGPLLLGSKCLKTRKLSPLRSRGRVELQKETRSTKYAHAVISSHYQPARGAAPASGIERRGPATHCHLTVTGLDRHLREGRESGSFCSVTLKAAPHIS